MTEDRWVPCHGQGNAVPVVDFQNLAGLPVLEFSRRLDISLTPPPPEEEPKIKHVQKGHGRKRPRMTYLPGHRRNRFAEKLAAEEVSGDAHSQ